MEETLLPRREGRLRGLSPEPECCLLYTSDAADERSSVDLGGRRIIKKKTSLTIASGSDLDTQIGHQTQPSAATTKH